MFIALIVLTVLVSVCGVIGILPAMMSPMMLDAPGSGRNPATLGLFFGVATFPLSCLASVVAAWLLHSFDQETLALWSFALPGGSLVVVGVAWCCLTFIYGGRFNG